MSELVFDIETDGLDATKVHCIVIKDIHSNVVSTYSDTKQCTGSLREGVDALNKAVCIIGHNIIKYDIPQLLKFYPDLKPNRVFDTLVGSRLIYPDVFDIDTKSKAIPTKLWGSHSLKAWGLRLGNPKQEIETDWSEFTQEMLDYCIQDCHTTHTLFQRMLAKRYSEQAIKLEHEVCEIISRQEQYGIMFDTEKATTLYAKLSSKREAIAQELQEVFPPIEVRTEFIPKVNNKARGYVKGEPFIKVSHTQFNPSSRQHIADRLKTLHDWKPKEFTPDGSPKVDDRVLNQLPFPEAKLLAEYFLLEKRLGMLGDGKQAYLKLMKDGRLHGSVNTNGAVTGRSTASNPNLQQVPAVYAPYGKEFRELFTVPKGYKMVGVDQSGIETRLLAHYLHKIDNGEYAKIVLDGDIHTANQEAAGLESRDLAKRFFYCWLYGGGVGKIAEVTGKTNKEAKLVKERFLNRMPALAKLIEQVHSAADRGYLVGLDGRLIKVRNKFSSLNTLLQGAGACCAKQWLVEVNRAIKKYDDVTQLLWIHDEIQIQVPTHLAEEVGQLAVDCIDRAGKDLGIRLPLDGEYKIGNNWSETH